MKCEICKIQIPKDQQICIRCETLIYDALIEQKLDKEIEQQEGKWTKQKKKN